jgi:heterotetrameric sarcosine oxidase gamma subunit
VAEPFAILERRGLGLATIMGRTGFDGAAVDLDLPTGPRCAVTGELTMIGTGPDVWLAVSEAPGADWPEALERRLVARCSVSGQSGGYIVFRISGPGARALLQRGVAMDLHPEVFVAGSAATTVIAHIGAILWRPAEAPDFDVAVFRSYAASFRDWVDAQVP